MLTDEHSRSVRVKVDNGIIIIIIIIGLKA